MVSNETYRGKVITHMMMIARTILAKLHYCQGSTLCTKSTQPIIYVFIYLQSGILQT